MTNQEIKWTNELIGEISDLLATVFEKLDEIGSYTNPEKTESGERQSHT